MCLVSQWCPTLCDFMDCSPPGSSVHRDSPGKNTGVGCHALLQEIFPTQGSNWGLPHCSLILYHLSHQGRPCENRVLWYSMTQGIFQINNHYMCWCPKLVKYIHLRTKMRKKKHGSERAYWHFQWLICRNNVSLNNKFVLCRFRSLTQRSKCIY